MVKKLLSYEYTPIIALLILYLTIGVFTAKDFGESIDELEIFNYANYSIRAYQYILHPQELNLFPTVINYYGPAYFMIADASSKMIKLLDSSLSVITARHFVYFFTFLTSILILYFLSRRWMSKWAAFGAALLFASQPLIWGHSFMNPKDIPFMVFFLASIYFGIQMLDASPNSKWRWLIPAGIILGLTISIRVIGPLAGLLVLIYAAIKFPRRILSTLPYYFLIAGITTYLTWPYLWQSPIANFLKSLTIMSRFPDIPSNVFFMGKLYSPNELPQMYFPILLGLQLTEPAVILILIGFAFSLWLFIKGINREPILLFTGWFLVPALWIILWRSPLYNNARQLLFLWPPLFILGGMGIDRLMVIVRLPWFRIALLMIMVLPGMYACIQLHPYEYVYYNSLIRGVKGASRKFELDYWETSFSESTKYLNDNAERGSMIVVIGTAQLVEDYARPDLTIVPRGKMTNSEHPPYYILSPTRGNRDLSNCHGSGMVFTVTRDGGILSYIKKIEPGQKCY